MKTFNIETCPQCNGVSENCDYCHGSGAVATIAGERTTSEFDHFMRETWKEDLAGATERSVRHGKSRLTFLYAGLPAFAVIKLLNVRDLAGEDAVRAMLEAGEEALQAYQEDSNEEEQDGAN